MENEKSKTGVTKKSNLNKLKEYVDENGIDDVVICGVFYSILAVLGIGLLLSIIFGVSL